MKTGAMLRYSTVRRIHLVAARARDEPHFDAARQAARLFAPACAVALSGFAYFEFVRVAVDSLSSLVLVTLD